MLLDQTLKDIRAKLGASRGFVHSVGTLVGGTAFAQAVSVLALPLLTRLYTPTEFSVFAVYVSLLSIVSVVACLRLEIAIPIPEDDNGAASLLSLALFSSAAVAVLTGILVLLFPQWVSARLGTTAIQPYLWMVPLGVWLTSSYTAVQYWSTRKKRFSEIARTRMAQALGGVGIQVSAGFAGLTPFGLLFGHMINGGIGVIGLARNAWRREHNALSSVDSRSMRDALRQYSRFPKYSTIDALTNTAGSQLPIILIAALAVGPEAGYLMLATRVMAAPMGLIGGAVSQVYFSRAPEDLRRGRLAITTTRIFGGLIKSGVGPILFAGIVASPLFSLVFGVEWERAGDLVPWLVPWLVFQFLSSPVSMVAHVRMRQASLLLLTTFGLALRVGTILVAEQVLRSHMVEMYAVASAMYYIVLTIAFYRMSDCRMDALSQELRKSLVFPIVWIALGLVARVGIIEWT